MGDIVFRTSDGKRWTLATAPAEVEITLSELCGASIDIIHAEGRHLVVGDQVWYTPTGINDETGALVCEMTRDERAG